MDAIRTLLLARTHVVVLDPDVAASAATRPSRDSDADKLEDELAQLGFVMSLDLAMTIRRLPNLAMQELRGWMMGTLGKTLGTHKPQVPLFRGFPPATPGNAPSLYLRRVMSWLATRAEQPCPWCGEAKAIRALDPCGHLVCNTCWGGGSYAGCPICHRRITIGDPFVDAFVAQKADDRVANHDGQLRLLHLAFDLLGTARARFEALMTRTTPLTAEDRAEIDAVIDTLGPKAASWLPKKQIVRETMALAVARLWIVSPDRHAILRATAEHLKTATDVLRVAIVLLGGSPALDDTPRLRSIPRAQRTLVLEALDRLPPHALVEDVRRHARLWKRVGERLHPFEHAARLPTAALAFAVVRGTVVTTATFGPTVRAQVAQNPALRIDDDRVCVTTWTATVEDGLRSGDARSVAEHLSARPSELLKRADHLVRVAQAKQPDALGGVLRTVKYAVTRGAPAAVLALGSHVAARGTPWIRRVFVPGGAVLRAWVAPDGRARLEPAAIESIVDAVRGELLGRAESRRHFARAVIDRGLVDLIVAHERGGTAWPRGSAIALPAGDELHLALRADFRNRAAATAALDLSVVVFDAAWRHVETCVADLDMPALRARGGRHALAVIAATTAPARPIAASFELTTPGGQLQFALGLDSGLAVPLAIDLETAQLRWLDVHIRGRGALHRAGGYHAALAHLGRDTADLAAPRARPTLWDVACIHATARANLLYVRERSGAIAQYRRRDGESTATRLARLIAGTDDGTLAMIPTADAPTWFCVVHDDLAIPKGSAGFALDRRGTHGDGVTFVAATDLVAELGARP